MQDQNLPQGLYCLPPGWDKCPKCGQKKQRILVQSNGEVLACMKCDTAMLQDIHHRS